MNKVAKANLKAFVIQGTFLRRVIADNELSTAKKYEAFRKVHPDLSLPVWYCVVEAVNTCGGWNFEICGQHFRTTRLERKSR